MPLAMKKCGINPEQSGDVTGTASRYQNRASMPWQVHTGDAGTRGLRTPTMNYQIITIIINIINNIIKVNSIYFFRPHSINGSLVA